MDRELNSRPSITSVTCTNANCGFHGSSATEGYCSVCYTKEQLRRKQSVSEIANKIIPKPEELRSIQKPDETPEQNPEMETSVFETSSPKVAEIEDPNRTSSKPKKAKKAKCGVCKKKLGLTGFDCRCGGLFCPTHRYSDKHECGFDYEKLGKEQLRKANPVVGDEKIVKFWGEEEIYIFGG